MEGHTMIYADYFDDEVTFADDFWRHYRMSKELFMSIVHGVREYNKYFVLKHGCFATSGFSSV
jgi:tetraacyldisaccharide-1-P 4'-kinase